MLRATAVLVASLMFGNAVAAAPDPVRLIANISPPYVDAKLPEQGLALELVNHVFKRAGYSTKITIDSWPRAMEGVELGIFDALASAWYTEERAAEFLFSEPYLSSKLVLLKARSDQGDYFELAHLEGKRLGVRVDYAYGVDFDSVPDLTLVEENHLIQNLLNLLNGSVDFVIGDQRTLALQLHEYLNGQVHKFEVVAISLPERGRHVAATRAIKGEDKMISAFNKALAETVKDGSHAAIVKKWDDRYGLIGQ
jgi:polar amino acid transport system substrate-binding protein